jgi:hypothetical protein
LISVPLTTAQTSGACGVGLLQLTPPKSAIAGNASSGKRAAARVNA